MNFFRNRLPLRTYAVQPLPSAYHRTKYESEKIVREESTVPWRVYRPAVVVGNDDVVGTNERRRGGALIQMSSPGDPDRAEMHVPVDDLAVQHVGRPDEPGDEGRGRLVVDLAGRANLLDLALVHHDDLVREFERLLLVVGDEQARHA